MDRPRDIVENPVQVRELYRKLHGWRIKTANTEPKTLAPRSILREKEIPQTPCLVSSVKSLQYHK